MPKYKLWFAISILVALAALAGAWLYNKNSFNVLSLSAGPAANKQQAIDNPSVARLASNGKQPTSVKVEAAAPTPADITPVEKKQVEKSASPTSESGPGPGPVVSPVGARAVDKPTPLALALQAKASFFAERFGTYSSARPYENVVGLKDYATDNYWQFLSDKQSQAKPSYPVIGFVATVVGTQVVALDEKAGTAEINVPLVRQSFAGDIYDVGQLYSLLIKFKKINNVWLIDGAYWN